MSRTHYTNYISSRQKNFFSLNIRKKNQNFAFLFPLEITLTIFARTRVINGVTRYPWLADPAPAQGIGASARVFYTANMTMKQRNRKETWRDPKEGDESPPAFSRFRYFDACKKKVQVYIVAKRVLLLEVKKQVYCAFCWRTMRPALCILWGSFRSLLQENEFLKSF